MIPYEHLTSRFFQPSSRAWKREVDLQNYKPDDRPRNTRDAALIDRYLMINDTMSKATMLMTLIIGLIAGPAVSL